MVRMRQTGLGSWRRDQLSVWEKNILKKYLGGRNDSGDWESFRQPVIPPAPLTGDVGRDCGDASRALLLFKLPPVYAGPDPLALPDCAVVQSADEMASLVSDLGGHCGCSVRRGVDGRRCRCRDHGSSAKNEQRGFRAGLGLHGRSPE